MQAAGRWALDQLIRVWPSTWLSMVITAPIRTARAVEAAGEGLTCSGRRGNRNQQDGAPQATPELA